MDQFGSTQTTVHDGNTSNSYRPVVSELSESTDREAR